MDFIYRGEGLGKDGYMKFEGNWQSLMKKNWKQLEACDEAARKAKSLVGRKFGIPVADGKAWYQVVKESKTRLTIQLCTGLGDDYADHHFRGGGSFSRVDVMRYINFEEGMRKLFGREK